MEGRRLARHGCSQSRLVKKVAYGLAMSSRNARIEVSRVVDKALDTDRRRHGGRVFHQGRTPRASARRALYRFIEVDVFLRKDGSGYIRVRVFTTLLVDPPWRFLNRNGKASPEHRRLWRYQTMSTEEIAAMPVPHVGAEPGHLYLWVPNALLRDGLRVMEAWGYTYKTNIPWYKVRKDGGPDGRGVGFYFRNVTEILLFGVKGRMRTLAPGRRQTNIIVSMKRDHSRKPDEQYDIIEACSPGPFLELFARQPRANWTAVGFDLDGARF